MNKQSEVSKFKTLVGNGIFNVSFVKKNGELRYMTCRFGVKKHLQGGELKYDAEALNYAIVFDMQEKAYRTINVNTIKSLTFNGVTYEL
jgi:hypothetical protein